MIEIERGFPSVDRPKAVRMFWEAFGDKLGRCMGPEPKALRFIDAQLRSHFSFAAYDNNQMLGLVGFKTSDGGLVGGEYRDLAEVYGYVSAVWRGAILSMFERDIENGQLLLDGIFVTEKARGRGVGTALLDAVEDYARFELYKEIRLDVIDSNPKARALYERRGYVAGKTSRAGLLKPFLGFSSATTMIRTL